MYEYNKVFKLLSVFCIPLTLGVMDTKSGNTLTVTQAIRCGVITPQDSTFVSTADGHSLTFHDALDKGYILSEKLEGDAHVNGNVTTIDDFRTSDGPSDYAVDDVLDPRTKYRVSLPYAVSKGIVQPEKSEYKNPDTGEHMSLTDAIGKGVVKATKMQPGSLVRNIINTLQLHDSAVAPVRYVLPNAKEDQPSVSAYKALSRHMDSNVKAILNHKGEPVSIREAFQSGLVRFDTLSYVNEDGSTMSLEKAAQEGLINMAAMQCILAACKKLSLQQHIDSGRISPSGAMFLSGEDSIPLDEAIKQRKLDPHSVFVRDNSSGSLMSLWCALENNVVTLDHGQTLGQYLENRDIVAVIQPSAALKTSYVIDKLTNGNKDISIKHPVTGEVLSLKEAVGAGLYDTQRAEVVDPTSSRRLSLAEAVDEGLITRQDARGLYAAMDSMSLRHAMANNIATTLENAIDEGYIIPETVFFVDQSSGRIGTLATGIEDADGEYCGYTAHKVNY